MKGPQDESKAKRGPPLGRDTEKMVRWRARRGARVWNGRQTRERDGPMAGPRREEKEKLSAAGRR